MKLINEIKMKNANANGMRIESFCAGNLSVLVCQLFISFSFSLFVSNLSKSFLLAFTLSAFTSQLFFTLILFVFFVFNSVIFVFTFFCILFHFHSLFLKNGSPHEEMSSVSGLLFFLCPLLCLRNMYVATVLVTSPMMGSFLSFSEGVS